jgi:hypothetical protein
VAPDATPAGPTRTVSAGDVVHLRPPPDRVPAS